MQGLVVLAIVILAIVLAFAIINFLLQIVFASLPAWGVAVSLMLLSQFLFRVYRVEELNSTETLSKMMTVSLDKNSNKLNWSLEESQGESYINDNAITSIVISVGISLLSFIIIMPILYQNGFFEGLYFGLDSSGSDKFKDISPEAGVVWGCILSGIIILIILGVFSPKKAFKKIITEKLNHLTSKVNTQLDSMDKLQSLENSIKSVASKLKVSFPVDYRIEIQRYISAHKTEILLNSAGLNNLIAKNIKQASEDNSRLEKALKLYNSAERFYKQISYEVIKTGSMPFIKILEDVYGLLNSENTRSFLTTREWKEYDGVISTAIEILKDLHGKAATYQEEGYEKERATYTEETRETDVERAFRILGIPPTATNEQIKKAWRAIVSAWHPDGKEGKEREKHEAQCKEINWAYDVLKRERKIT